MKTRKLPLTLPEYQRIYEVIYSVVNPLGEVQNACLFFSVVGALILEIKHGIKAHPVAGAAVFYVDDKTSTACTFGRVQDGELVADKGAFHCWVETDDWAIDLMAPLLRESMAQRGSGLLIPRRMFQKPLKALVASLNDLKAEGDFALLPDVGLSRELFSVFDRKVSYSDLVNVCVESYEPYPKKLKVTHMTDSYGNAYALKTSAPSIVGSW